MFVYLDYRAYIRTGLGIDIIKFGYICPSDKLYTFIDNKQKRILIGTGCYGLIMLAIPAVRLVSGNMEIEAFWSNAGGTLAGLFIAGLLISMAFNSRNRPDKKPQRKPWSKPECIVNLIVTALLAALCLAGIVLQTMLKLNFFNTFILFFSFIAAIYNTHILKGEWKEAFKKQG